MSIHLHKFIERLQGFEARGAKEFIMPINDAKGIHADLTRLLLELNDLKEAALSTEEVIKVTLDGGTF